MITVLNPNSSPAVTAAIESSVQDAALGVDFRVTQLDEAPIAIESAEDVQRTAPLVAQFAAALHPGARLVVACHADPGLALARKRASAGVRITGIGESSMLAACAVADRFGVVSLMEDSVQRKWEMVTRLGLADRCAAIEASGTSVLHGVDPQRDSAPYLTAAERCVQQGADAVVLGCAGMAGGLAQELEAALGVPVIEPVSAAAGLLNT
ncbi:aspartate/glutamate racemase family protein [Nesterenkonia ebinurensis]|uniref:aspartate/glutamate racemase family protein n=1 Tax=Nesterenkonia ebinurensis TaxID=2608252 RepID=UPI00123D103F|nr:aspartate/glutamate racemase family protein [Nesterenkonia ebinurensis]